MYLCPTVETERLILRPFTEADIDRYADIHNDPQVRSSLHIEEPLSRDEAWKHLALWTGQWGLRNSGQWALELKTTGEMIGRAGTHRPQRVGWPGLEVGWTLDPVHQGLGYATEAGRASVGWAFANHEDHELVSTILPVNTASQAVAKRLGFTFLEDRVLPHLPSLPVGIWVLPRPA